jgi:hypothetical protein
MGCNFYTVRTRINNLPFTEILTFLKAILNMLLFLEFWLMTLTTLILKPLKITLPMLVLKVKLKMNMAKAKPHFFMDNIPAIGVIQSVLSIQLFRSAVSPLRMDSVTIIMFSIIQATIVFIVGVLWVSV